MLSLLWKHSDRNSHSKRETHPSKVSVQEHQFAFAVYLNDDTSFV